MQLWQRSYSGGGHTTAHDFVQIVLPLEGHMEIEIEGTGGVLDSTTAGFVDVGARHAESVSPRNRFLVLDLESDCLPDTTRETLTARRFLPIEPVTRHLITALHLTHASQTLEPANLRHYAPLLCASFLAPVQPQRDFRIERLTRAIAENPGARWSNAAMARFTGLSLSRLHAVFQRETGHSLQGFVRAQRVQWLSTALSSTNTPLATLAQDAGFADQSTMTRAFARATGQTPAAFRSHAGR